jgi:hypothetical protein
MEPPRNPVGIILVAVGDLGDDSSETSLACFDQVMGIRPAFEDRQVGQPQVSGERGHGKQLAHQVLDADLVQGALVGEPVTGPHPSVQCRLVGRVELERAQPVGIDDGQLGKGISVDAVGLGVAREVPAHVVRFGRGDPEDLVTPRDEEHRDGQPRQTGGFHHDLEHRARLRPRQGSLLERAQALGGGDRLAFGHHLPRSVEHPGGVLAGDAQVQADDPAFIHVQPPVSFAFSGRPRWSAPSRATVPRWPPGGGHHSCAAHGSGLADRATSLMRVIRGQAERWQSVQRGEGTAPSLRAALIATPRPAGMLMQPRDRRSVVDPPPGVPYMRCIEDIHYAPLIFRQNGLVIPAGCHQG